MKPAPPSWPDARLREALKQLWREAFGDTDEYISLVFGRVYGQSVARWCEAGAYPSLTRYAAAPHRPIAMLFATRYRFGTDEQKRRLTGVYLSGLATDAAYRCRGIMGTLLERFIAECMSGEHCPDLLFLIPADSHLRRYYERFGFRSSGTRVVATVDVPAVDAASGEWRVADLSRLSTADRAAVHALVSQYEKRGQQAGCLQIFHSRQAIDTAIAESALNGGRVVMPAIGRQSSERDTSSAVEQHGTGSFLWVETTPGGWVAKCWEATSPGELTAMLREVCHSEALPNTRMSCVVYGGVWQARLIEALWRAGGCSAPVNERYGMVLPLSKEGATRPLSIGLMLD